MSINGKNRVPWSDELRRVQNTMPEWMAPPSVVQQVRSDYLSAQEWLQASALKSWSHQAAAAPLYLAGSVLDEQQRLVQQNKNTGEPQCIGVLRADHRVYVRHFSEDGVRCLVIDQQSQRRMATYDFESQTRVHTQDLGASTVVYQMVYDLRAQRWKINAFIQRLPAGWNNPNVIQHLQWMAESPPDTGRDH